MGRLHRSPAATLARAGLVGLLGLGAAACATGGGGGRVADYRPANLRPYEVNGRRYSPRVDDHYEQKGLASWYSYPAGTRRTASGEPFDGHSIAGAHKTLPLPCIVEVTNLENGRKLRVRINDRGPFAAGRIIDLTPAAADRLGFRGHGVAKVRVKFVGPAPVADSGRIELAQASDAPAAAAPAEGLF